MGVSMATMFVNTFYLVACSMGATTVAKSPNYNIFVCKDDSENTCEKDFGKLCPNSFELCSPDQYNNNNDGWNGTAQTTLLGKIYCRSGSGAGHVYLGNSNPYSKDISHHDSGMGSSLPECPGSYGCNEKRFAALCCNISI